MKGFNRSSLVKVTSAFIVLSIAVLFQNCSEYKMVPVEDNSVDSLDIESKARAKRASVASSSTTTTTTASGKVVSAKLTLLNSLVLKPSDYPHLVLHGPDAGLFVDGPPHPWKDDLGNTYVNIPHSENYRYLIGNKNSTTNPWLSPQSWKIQEESIFDSRKDYIINGVKYHLGGNCIESQYDNRIWLYGFWSTGKNISVIAHHEWYANCSRGYNTAAQTNTHWVNGIVHLTSTNGGKSFLPRPLGASGNSNRMVLVPEPKSVQNPLSMYGFFHPSNIVKEGDFYYATAEIQDFTGKRNSEGLELITEGFVIVRTRNISSPSGWELFDSQKNWVPVLKGYQGNLGQKPHIFFPREFNPYKVQDLSSFAATNLRFHKPTQTWLAIGVLDGQYTILQSSTLSNPQFDIKPIIVIQGVQATFPFYISAFDPNQFNDSTDFNYMNTGNQLVLLHMKNYEGYAQYNLTLTTEGGGTVEPPPPPPPSGGVITFPMSAMVGFFKVGDHIYLGGTKTYCYISSMEQYKLLTNSYDISVVKSLSAIPAGLTTSGNCMIPAGIVFLGTTDIYYVEKNEYCHIPSMEFYSRFTSDYPIARIPHVSALPSTYINRGFCQ